MKEKNMGSKLLFVIVGIIVIAGAFGSGYLLTEEKIQEKIVYQEKEQPMIMIILDGWAENLDDSSELIFNYWVYNFGSVEAKNVMIKCYVEDKDENLKKEQTFNIGNIASLSSSWEESIIKYPSSINSDVGGCVFVSADGEYMDLLGRLLEREK